MKRRISSVVGALLLASAPNAAAAAPTLPQFPGNPQLSGPGGTSMPRPTISPCVFSQTLSPPPVAVFPLYGKGTIGAAAKLTVRGRVQYQAQRMQLVVTVSVNGSEGSFGRRKNVALPVVVPAGCEISDISRTAGEQKGEGRQNRILNLPASDLLGRSSCIIAVRGDEWGRIGCSSVQIQPFKVNFRKATTRQCPRTRMFVPNPHEVTDFRDVVRGDRVFGRNTKIKAEAQARVVKGTQVWVRSRITLRERGSDQSEIRSAWKDQFIGDVAKINPRCTISEIVRPNPTFTTSTREGGHYVAPTNEYIGSVSCRIRGGRDGKPSCLLSFTGVNVEQPLAQSNANDWSGSIYYTDF